MDTKGVEPSAPPAPKAVPLRPEYPQAPPPGTSTVASAQGAPETSTLRPAVPTAGAVEPRRVGCCGRCLSAHTSSEAGLSFWVHSYVLAATRFFSVIGLSFISGFLFTNGGGSSFPLFVTVAEAVSFLFLSICSVLASFGKPAKALASIAVPLHQTIVTCAVISFPSIFFFTGYYWHHVVALWFIPQVAVFLLDTSVLGARIRFRYVYIWFSVALLGSYLIAIVAAFVAIGLGIGIGIAVVIIGIILVVIAGIIATALTRITGCIGGRVRSRREAEEVAAPIASNV